jgi:hypothetical protein
MENLDKNNDEKFRLCRVEDLIVNAMKQLENNIINLYGDEQTFWTALNKFSKFRKL